MVSSLQYPSNVSKITPENRTRTRWYHFCLFSILSKCKYGIISLFSRSLLQRKFDSRISSRRTAKIEWKLKCTRTHAPSCHHRQTARHSRSFILNWVEEMNVHSGWKHILMLTMQVNGKLNIPRTDSIWRVIFNSINWQAEEMFIRSNCCWMLMLGAFRVAFNLPSTGTRPKAERNCSQ